MKILLFIQLLALSSLVFAGPGHKHSHGKGHHHKHSGPEISKEKTQKIGKKHIKRLIQDGKINSSWSTATYKNSEKKKFNGVDEWVVTFQNTDGVKGKVLYIFLKLDGKFVAANFTGK